MTMNMKTIDSIFTADRNRLIEEAIEARERALWLAPGPARDRLIQQARHCETGAQGLRWAESSGLQPPRRGRLKRINDRSDRT
jgi:hypothetical protein